MASIDLNCTPSGDGYTCQTCGKPFGSVQALGGHQNAHRKERFALRRRHVQMKRHLASQASLLPRPTQAGVGPSNMPWPPAMPAPPYLVNSMAPLPPEAAIADDVADGLDLTLRL
ncbi:hypothetical protein V2J09_020654 [Rumex salicifolius]